VRARFVLIAVAFAVLAYAGLGAGDARPVDALDSAHSSSQLSAQPAPDAALPSVITASVKGSATVDTSPFSMPRRHTQRGQGVTLALRQALPASAADARPRAFPLLI
jgi:hypothetical protein